MEKYLDNVYKLMEDEKIIDRNGQVAFGPAMVRIEDFDEDNLHSLQVSSKAGSFLLEVQGDPNDSVQKISPPKDSAPSDVTLK